VETMDVPDIRFRLAGYLVVFYYLVLIPDMASEIATRYFVLSITALEHECHKILSDPTHL